MPLWVRKAGAAEGGYCAITRQAWVPSRAQWLPMDFLEDEARRDLKLHGRVLAMDCEEFSAHAVGFYKRADMWIDRRSASQSRAPSLPSKDATDADISRHVFTVDSGGRDLTTATTSEDVPELARGLSRPSP